MELLPHVPILVNETGHLLLQPVILLHQQLVHCSQLPVHSLQARGLLPLLFTASTNRKNHQNVSHIAQELQMSLAYEETMPTIASLQSIPTLLLIPHITFQLHMRMAGKQPMADTNSGS
jgi:hypothetical protein